MSNPGCPLPRPPPPPAVCRYAERGFAVGVPGFDRKRLDRDYVAVEQRVGR